MKAWDALPPSAPLRSASMVRNIASRPRMVIPASRVSRLL
ncbi:hypothetical protein SXANM310S_03469 [Streptomyces xanthochromogenes]